MPGPTRLSLLESLPAPLERGLEAVCRRLEDFTRVVVAYWVGVRQHPGGGPGRRPSGRAGVGDHRRLPRTGSPPAPGGERPGPLAGPAPPRAGHRGAGRSRLCRKSRGSLLRLQARAASPAGPHRRRGRGGPGAGRCQPGRPRRPPARHPRRPGIRRSLPPGRGRHRQGGCASSPGPWGCPGGTSRPSPVLPPASPTARRSPPRGWPGWRLPRSGCGSGDFPNLRVRSQGKTARIEIPAAGLPVALDRLARGGLRLELVAAFTALGFSAVALDLEGLVSGKLNRDLSGR